MFLINIPIEPIEERYSLQWDKWFKDHFEAAEINVRTIYGDTTSGKINKGSFLDIIETNLYKTSQLSQIIRILADYDDSYDLVLFFHDLWFPGLSNIAYIRDGLNLKHLKICGCLHAGSYDPFDFLAKQGMASWAALAEESWFGKIVDQIYVATEFHKSLLCWNRSISVRKILVTGFPIFDEFLKGLPKNHLPTVVFPHRLDSEKNPDTFDSLKSFIPDKKILWGKTMELGGGKVMYASLLAGAHIAVSCADQETWGIAMQEAVFCGCIPLVPNRLSYEEMYLPEFKYKSFAELVDKIEMYLDTPPTDLLLIQKEKLLSSGALAIPNIIKAIKKLVE